MKQKFKHPGAYFMVLPSYLIYLIFVLIPICATIYLSFTNYDLYRKNDFIGLNNYVRLFKDTEFLISTKNTFIYALFTIVPQILLGLILAAVLNCKVLAQRFHRVSFYLPHVTSMASISMVWLWIYEPSNGIMNQAIKLLGFPAQRWLFDPNLALASIIFMGLWKLIGYNMIIYLAALQQIPEHLYEAALIDGASPFRQFVSITVPMLRPITFFLFITAGVASFSVFEQVNVMTQGGPMNATTTIVHQIYQRGFTQFQMGYASSMAVCLLVILVVFTALNFKYGNQASDL
jgi:ABC-type sugar transport system permease subunit